MDTTNKRNKSFLMNSKISLEATNALMNEFTNIHVFFHKDENVICYNSYYDPMEYKEYLFSLFKKYKNEINQNLVIIPDENVRTFHVKRIQALLSDLIANKDQRFAFLLDGLPIDGNGNKPFEIVNYFDFYCRENDITIENQNIMIPEEYRDCIDGFEEFMMIYDDVLNLSLQGNPDPNGFSGS